MIGASDKRPAGYFRKTDLKGSLSPNIKFLRWDKTGYRKVLGGRLKVLTQCQDAAAHIEQILERFLDFFGFLPQAEHEA